MDKEGFNAIKTLLDNNIMKPNKNKKLFGCDALTDSQ